VRVEGLRFGLALVVLLGLPGGVLLWLFIHPFAAQWRRIGAAWTYAILLIPVTVVDVVVFRARGWLLAVDYGTHVGLIALGALCALGAGLIAAKRRRLLTLAVLAGLPELSPERYPPRLLTEGIYGRIRHPRYVELALWVLAYACVANYLATWIAFALLIPAMYLVVVLEERELRERFGDEYEAYAEQVPRFIPRSPTPRPTSRSGS
jgi:protein-S-isoprenylcysteine O-methyltransferase Ste14